MYRGDCGSELDGTAATHAFPGIGVPINHPDHVSSEHRPNDGDAQRSIIERTVRFAVSRADHGPPNGTAY